MDNRKDVLSNTYTHKNIGFTHKPTYTMTLGDRTVFIELIALRKAFSANARLVNSIIPMHRTDLVLKGEQDDFMLVLNKTKDAMRQNAAIKCLNKHILDVGNVVDGHITLVDDDKADKAEDDDDVSVDVIRRQSMMSMYQLLLMLVKMKKRIMLPKN